MQITANQTIAGYPAMKVRDFLWACQLIGIVNKTAEAKLALSSEVARYFLNQLSFWDLSRNIAGTMNIRFSN